MKDIHYEEKHYEDYEVGQRHHTPGRTITEADLVLFSGITGDFALAHTDEEYSKKGIFNTRIAHGSLIEAVSLGLCYRIGIPGADIAYLGLNNLKFLAPVKPGDTITAVVEVIGKRESRKPGRGIVTLKHTVKNQNEEAVCEYETAFLLKKRGA